MSFQWSKSQINLPSSNSIKYVDTDGNNIVAIDSQDAIYYTSKISNDSIFSSTQTWTQKTGSLSAVSVSGGKIMGYNNSNQVWYSPTLSTSGDWTDLTQIGKTMKTINYDSISNVGCGVRTDLDTSVAKNYLTCNVFSNNIWRGNNYSIGSTLYGAVYNGNLYIINSTNYDIYCLRNITTQSLWSNYVYVRRPNNNTVNLKQLDFNNNILVGIENNTNNVWFTTDVYKETPTWYLLSNIKLTQISVGDNGICGITPEGKLIYCFKTNINGENEGKYQSAVIDQGTIYINSDYGNTWTSKESSRIWNSISISASGQFQTAVVNLGQIYISSDYGNTWTSKESNRNWWCISLSSSGQYQSVVVYSGQIYVSSDYGNTWTPKESIRKWKGISLSSSGQYQTAVSDYDYIYISSDYGNTWTPKESSRRWESVSISINGQYQTAVGNQTLIYISSDYGNTWTSKNVASNWWCISVSSSGQYQTVISTGISGKLFVSSDYGNTWTQRSVTANWSVVSVSSSGIYQSAVAASSNQIYISKNYGLNWTTTGITSQWSGVSVSCDLPKCKNNYDVSYILKDIDDWAVDTNSDIMNVRKSSTNIWNPLGSLDSNGYNILSSYKILVSFSQPVNIQKIYFRFTNGIDTNHSATSIKLYPNVFIGNSTSRPVANIIKMSTGDPSSLLTVSNLLNNLSSDFNYYVKNPVTNTDTGFYRNYTIVFDKAHQWQLWLMYLDFDISVSNPPNKVTISSVSQINNGINLSYKIPNNNGNPITKYTIKSYYTENNIAKCGPKTIIDMTNQNNPYYSLLNKSVDTNVTIGINNINNRLTFVGTPSNLPSCEPYDDYSFVKHTPIINEPYIFTLKSINTLGESNYSDPTSDVVPIVSSPPPPPPPPPQSPPPLPPAEENNKKLYTIIALVLTFLIILGLGFWYLKNKKE